MKTICTLRSMLSRNLECNPDKIALIEGGRQYTFREFADRTRRMGNALLNLGLKKGDRVAILSQNSIENAESYFSITCAGLVLVMLNFRLAPKEILTILEDSEAPVIMVNENYLGHIEEIREDLSYINDFIFIGDPPKTPKGWYHYEDLIEKSAPTVPDVELTENDLAALMYTSGTTGSPKGCMVIHRNFYHIGRSLTLELKMDGDDFGIIASPMFHATGEVTLMNHIFSGTSSVIMPQFTIEDFLKLVEKYRVTTGMLATPMLSFLVDFPDSAKYDTSSMKKFYFAGASVNPVVYEKAIHRFGNIFIHFFGTTETVGQTNLLRLKDIEKALEAGKTEILASVGKSFTDMESLVVDENDNPVPPGVVGEIKVRGLGTTLGYWKKEDQTKQVYKNGWYYPLDLCKVDEEGFMYVVDRKKDLIITGGENVYPAEVENVLYKHPIVAQAAVIGLPDRKWGEVVTAVIIKRNGTKVSEDDIKTFCRKEIAGFKVPKKVFFVDELPMSASGKILKYQVRDELSQTMTK